MHVYPNKLQNWPCSKAVRKFQPPSCLCQGTDLSAELSSGCIGCTHIGPKDLVTLGQFNRQLLTTGDAVPHNQGAIASRDGGHWHFLFFAHSHHRTQQIVNLWWFAIPKITAATGGCTLCRFQCIHSFVHPLQIIFDTIAVAKCDNLMHGRTPCSQKLWDLRNHVLSGMRTSSSLHSCSGANESKFLPNLWKSIFLQMAFHPRGCIQNCLDLKSLRNGGPLKLTIGDVWRIGSPMLDVSRFCDGRHDVAAACDRWLLGERLVMFIFSGFSLEKISGWACWIIIQPKVCQDSAMRTSSYVSGLQEHDLCPSSWQLLWWWWAHPHHSARAELTFQGHTRLRTAGGIPRLLRLCNPTWSHRQRTSPPCPMPGSPKSGQAPRPVPGAEFVKSSAAICRS